MNDLKFINEYKKLNKAQKEAVDSIEGPVMVIAGPGTGKTTILTLRIANILKTTDTGASGILALTFTDAGVKAMRNKLRGIIGELALEIPIFTFHSFASSIINEYPDHFPHLKNTKQITEVESEQIIKKILKDRDKSLLRPIGEPNYYIDSILSSISTSKKEAWTGDMITKFAKKEIEVIKDDPNNLSTRGTTKGKLKGEALKKIEKCEKTIIFGKIYDEYEINKKREGKIDFDDLIFELLLRLKEDKLLLQIIQEKFLYILIDEHQDTNDSQNLIIKTIANFFDNPNVFIVGDEKQAIYRFQGASIENFLDFKNIWKNIKIISLKNNYRSHQNILDGAYNIIQNNYNSDEFGELRVKLDSKSSYEKKPINLIISPDSKTEEIFIYKKIKEILKNEPSSNIAVILRKNSQVGRIYNFLYNQGLNISAERGADMFNHFLGEMFFDILQFIDDPTNTEQLCETIACGLWGLSFNERIDLLKKIRKGELKEIEKKLPKLVNLISKMPFMGAVEYLIQIASISGVEIISKKDPLYNEVWRSIIHLSEEIAKTNKIENPKLLIRELLNYRKTAKRKSIKVKSGILDANIVVLTAHSSKGLEFDYVFIPYATEESWITKSFGSHFILPKEKDLGDNIKDERRLFYVAITRAKKDIFISTHKKNETGKETDLLRFIDEISKDKINTTDIKAENFDYYSHKNKKSDSNTIEMNEYAKRVLLENGLSVTALNHFVECPKQFFYKSILKVPEAPNSSSEKGNAMHEAMSNIWHSKNKGKKEIEKIIKTAVKNYMNKSLLPQYEKETIAEELEKSAPIIAESLYTHFIEKGHIKTEDWIERLLTFTIKEVNVELKIHGKLDLLLETHDKLLIYDYKTREGMSVNSIKGDGGTNNQNYWRQLVFYKILMEKISKIKNKKVEPALVFLKPKKTNTNRCPIVSLEIEEVDEKKVLEEIKNLIETVWKNELFNKKCNDEECKYCKE